jgi:hypothetical protein
VAIKWAYRLQARTRSSKSPPLAEVAVAAQIAPFVADSIDKAWHAIGEWRERRRERGEILSDLFGSTGSAEFIVGSRYPEDEESWGPSVANAVASMIGSLSPVFFEPPELVPEEESCIRRKP